MKQLHDQYAQIAQFATTFRDRALVWYMKFQTTTPARHIRTVANIKTMLILELKKPKSNSQCIKKLKEIKQGTNDSVWDFERRFKSLMNKLTFQILAQQHKEWLYSYPSTTYYDAHVSIKDGFAR